jgi:hypothetical protein
MWIRALGLAIAHTFGPRIVDQRTGKSLGRALLIPWRGKIHVIGLETAVRVLFLPQKRLTYWKQEIGFETHSQPDFPNTRKDPVGLGKI